MSGLDLFVEAGGLRFHCVQWGRHGSPTLVLLHGLRAYARWFEEFAIAVEDRFRLIALDQRGRGESGWAPDGAYATDAYVADLQAVAEALGLGRFSLVGHSMGGTNAVNFAAAHPDRVPSLIIVDSAPELHQAGLERIRRELGATPESFASWSAARAFIRGLHTRCSDASIATRLRWTLRERPDGRIGWRLDPAIFDPRFTPDPPSRMWECLARIKCPTLIVRGAESDLMTAAMAEKMRATIPTAQIATVAAAGHMVVEDNPDGFVAAVLPFLREVALRADA